MRYCFTGIFFFLLICTLSSFAQNLVSDPSFEDATKLPCKRIKIAQFDDFTLKHWSMPTYGSPDIFSTQVSKKCWSYAAGPKGAVSSAGHQLPRSGNNMVGIFTYGKYNYAEYHEYIQTELMDTLVPGNKYYAEFWVTRSELVNISSNNIGMLLSEKEINKNSTLSIIADPQLNEDKIITDSINWIKISDTIVVDKPYRYLLIGNFYRDIKTEIKATKPQNNKLLLDTDEAYYYIDDVKLIPVN